MIITVVIYYRYYTAEVRNYLTSEKLPYCYCYYNIILLLYYRSELDI